MLLPFMADGIAMYRLECKADVIAFVVDGIYSTTPTKSVEEICG